MSLADLVTVNISSATVSPTRPGFGTPLMAAYHTKWTDYARTYSSLAGAVSDGFGPTDTAYQMVAAAFAQNPAPTQVMVGRLAHSQTQTIALTLGSASNLDTYTLTIVGVDGVAHVMDFASTGVVNTDAASLTAAINAIYGGLAVNTGSPSAVVTLSPAAGKKIDIQRFNPSGGVTPIITLVDNTTAANLAADLNAILANTLPGSWYGLATDDNSAASITAAAAWAEANGAHLYLYNNSDTRCITSSSADIFSTEKALAHARSGGLYAGTNVLAYSGAAWLGKTLPQNPGSLTFMYKTLAGVAQDVLTETAQTNLNGKNANYYTPVAGIGITINGWDAAGEFLDIVWGTDALTSQIQIDVFTLLANSPKVPYTDLGVDMIKSIINGDIALFSSPAYNFIASVPAPTVTAPLVASQSTANRAARKFPGIAFSGKLAGAIHQLTINGVLQP